MTRIFSGIQPSGSLHIGNYLGAVKNWVELQHKYESFFCILDYHAITVPYEPADLRARTTDMALSLLAAGLDPSKCTLFVQSMVPVGDDQLQHLELSREIGRKWNARFDVGFFPEPNGLLTPTRRIMGLDGQAKMSKSLGNTVDLLEDPASIWEKLKPAVTDPKRVRRTDPGTPEVCNIYHLHKAFSPAATVEHVAVQCRTAGWGCIDCKKVLHESMEKELAPIRARAKDIAANPKKLKDDLAAGAEHARTEAQKTMREVKKKMGLT